jgi:S1-C subfamily serine protease
VSRLPLLLCVAFPLLAAPDWNTLNRGIVKVEAAKKAASDTGAGIVIAAASDSIRILTAAHVVADATALRIYFYSDQVVGYAATVLPRSSDGLDLAVLEVRPQGRALPANLPRLPMRDRDTLAVDERIWTIDSEWIHIPNTVVRLDHDSDTRLFEYTKVAVDDGFSGGPVFDDQGRLVWHSPRRWSRRTIRSGREARLRHRRPRRARSQCS